MTRTQTRAYGVIAPSSRQLLLEAMLRAFVWLVSNVVSTLRTIFNRPTRDWHTGRAEEGQRPTPNDIHKRNLLGPPGSRPAVGAQRRNTTLPDQAHQPILRDDRRSAPIPQDERGSFKRNGKEALILSSAQSVRPSKGERRLTALSPLMPTNVGIQGRLRTLSEPAASSLHPQQSRSWIPTLILSLSKDVGMRGSCCAKPA